MRINQTEDITDEVLDFIRERVTAHLEAGKDISDLIIDFKAIERGGVDIIHTASLRHHPYDYKYITHLVTGISMRKIAYLVDKK